MARGMNHIRLAGTVTRPPELRYTPAGLAILEVNLGGDDQVTDQDGMQRQLPWYHRISLFGVSAEHFSELPVGSGLLIDGRLDFRSWANEDGEKRNSLDVVGLRAEMLDLTGRSIVTDAKGQSRLADAINEVTLIGNLTRDVEMRSTSGGHSLATFGVAVNERFRPKNTKEDHETVHFVEVRAWRDVADRCQSLTKGSAAHVQGRLITDNWEDQNGNRRYATRVEAQRIERIAFFQKTAA